MIIKQEEERPQEALGQAGEQIHPQGSGGGAESGASCPEDSVGQSRRKGWVQAGCPQADAGHCSSPVSLLPAPQPPSFHLPPIRPPTAPPTDPQRGQTHSSRSDLSEVRSEISTNPLSQALGEAETLHIEGRGWGCKHVHPSRLPFPHLQSHLTCLGLPTCTPTAMTSFP